jgi:hypothetical protein
MQANIEEHMDAGLVDQRAIKITKRSGNREKQYTLKVVLHKTT